MQKIIITKNAELLNNEWHIDCPHSDEEDCECEGEWVLEPVEYPSTQMLHDLGCYLEEGVTLRTIFELVNKQLDFWDLYLGNWCAEITKEGLQDVEDDDPLDKLVLAWQQTIERYDDEVDVSRPGALLDFHGLSGDTRIGLSFTSAAELAPTPLEVDSKWYVAVHDHVKGNGSCVRSVIPEFDAHVQPSLFQIMYSIFWELSFYGSPEDRDKRNQELMETWAKIKDDPADQ